MALNRDGRWEFRTALTSAIFRALQTIQAPPGHTLEFRDGGTHVLDIVLREKVSEGLGPVAATFVIKITA